MHEWLGDVLGLKTELLPLAVEASTRRFFRISGPTRSMIVMDSPPQTENNQQFVALSRVFRANRIPVPKIIAVNPDQGFILVQDFGDHLFYDAYRKGTKIRDLCLKLATDNLVKLQEIHSNYIHNYSVERFNRELMIFDEWVLRQLVKTSSQPLDKIKPLLINATQDQRQTTIHRDYHSRNLLLRANNQLGIIDYQDALVGPIAYDLASLVYDCYVDLPTSIVSETIQRFCELTAQDKDQFQRALELTAIQRSLKAVGLFIRLSLEQGRDSHLQHIDRVLGRIARLSNNHIELRAFSSWIGDDIRSKTKLALQKKLS